MHEALARALNVPLRDWSTIDTARIGVLLARTIPSGDGNELPNLAALRKLGPKKFDQILPVRGVPGEVLTIGQWARKLRTRFQLGLLSSARSSSGTLTLTTISRSKSRPASRSR